MYETAERKPKIEIKGKIPDHNVGVVLHPNELFDQLQRLTRAGIWTIDLGNMEIIVSDEMYRLHGVPLGTPVTYYDFLEMMCIKEDVQIVEEARIKAVTQKVEVEFEYRSKDQTTGEIKWFCTHVAPYLDKDKNVVALYGTTQDITLIKKAVFQKTQERLATMGEAINLLAHHWRQPLSTVAAACTKLRVAHSLETLSKEDLIETLESIEKKAHELSETINDVKKIFSDVRLPVKDLFLNKIVQSVVSDHQKKCEELGIVIKVSPLGPGCPAFRTQNGNFIRSIVNELILNSIDSLESVKKSMKLIVVRTIEDGLGYSIIVEDNGWGVSVNDKDKVFEPYYSTKDEMNGHGLGLYVSKMLAKLHLFGDLECVESSGGTCFQLKLPQMISNL